MERGSERRLWCVEDLYTLPDDGRRYELQAGVLLSEPLPGARHGLVVARVVQLLGDVLRESKLGHVLAGDAGFVLARAPDTVRGPDVAFVSAERMRRVEEIAKAFPAAPDLAVEVLSPSDRPADVHGKVADYLAGGTRLVWVIDPENERVTVYESLLSPRFLGPDDRLEGGNVVPGFDVAVSDIFEL